MIIDIPDEMVARLRKLAATAADWEDDDFEVHSYCGGNVDDAYARGEGQGEISIAREIVALMPKEG
jgi:hypothetical protein